MKKVIVHHHVFERAEKLGLASRKEHIFPYTDAICALAPRHVEALAVLWKAGCYEKVAEIDRPIPCNSAESFLEYAWERTNHIFESWNRPGVVGVHPVRNTNNRSSMVGDIFELVDGNNVSKLYRCASLGFEQFEEYTDTELRAMVELSDFERFLGK